MIIGKVLEMQSQSSNKKFSDEGQISNEGRSFVNAMANQGIINGYPDGSFKPNGLITRGEATAIIKSAIGELVNSKGDVTQNVEGNLVVNTQDVNLKNMKISGNLYILEGVADGDITLDKVQVSGKTYIRGGGTSTIKVMNSQLGDIYVNKESSPVRVVLQNSTASEIDGKNGAKIELKEKSEVKSIKTDSASSYKVEDKSVVQSVQGKKPEVKKVDPVKKVEPPKSAGGGSSSGGGASRASQPAPVKPATPVSPTVKPTPPVSQPVPVVPSKPIMPGGGQPNSSVTIPEKSETPVSSVAKDLTESEKLQLQTALQQITQGITAEKAKEIVDQAEKITKDKALSEKQKQELEQGIRNIGLLKEDLNSLHKFKEVKSGQIILSEKGELSMATMPNNMKFNLTLIKGEQRLVTYNNQVLPFSALSIMRHHGVGSYTVEVVPSFVFIKETQGIQSMPQQIKALGTLNGKTFDFTKNTVTKAGDIHYDKSTKTLSWNKVDHATHYDIIGEITVSNGEAYIGGYYQKDPQNTVESEQPEIGENNILHLDEKLKSGYVQLAAANIKGTSIKLDDERFYSIESHGSSSVVAAYKSKMNEFNGYDVYLKFYIVPKAPGTNYINEVYLENRVSGQPAKTKTSSDIVNELKDKNVFALTGISYEDFRKEFLAKAYNVEETVHT